MQTWIEGNSPDQEGTYWVTVKNGGGKAEPNRVYYQPLYYIKGQWKEPMGAVYYKENVVAYMICPVPQPYNPNKIGDAESFYIKVTRPKGIISYYSKQLHSINWSTIGYSTVEKATAAMKRLQKLELQETPNESVNCIYEVVNGNGEVIN